MASQAGIIFASSSAACLTVNSDDDDLACLLLLVRESICKSEKIPETFFKGKHGLLIINSKLIAVFV